MLKIAIALVVGFAAGVFAVILYLLARKSDPTLGDADRLELVEIEYPGGDPIKQTGEINEMSEIREGKQRRLKAIPKTRNGHAAAIEPGSMRWTSSDESVVQVIPDPNNELEADVIGVDGSNNDSALVEARADGIRGEGVRELIATKSYVCTQGDAAVFEFEEGDETDVPDAPPANGGGESQTIGSGEVGSAEEVLGGDASSSSPVEGTGGVGSGAGNTANQGVDANPSAGVGAGEASGTTSPDESNQPPAETTEAMTFDEAAADTADRNADTVADRAPDIS